MKWREKKNPSNLGQNHQTLEIINSSVCYCNVDLRKKKKKEAMLGTQKSPQLLPKFATWRVASGECKWWVHSTSQNYPHDKL